MSWILYPMYVCPDSYIDTIPRRAPRAEQTAARSRTFGVRHGWFTESVIKLDLAVLRNFAIFTGKNLCWSFFLIKLQLQAPTLVFSYEYFNILKNTYFEEHLWTAASNYGNLDNFFDKIYLVEESTILQFSYSQGISY